MYNIVYRSFCVCVHIIIIKFREREQFICATSVQSSRFWYAHKRALGWSVNSQLIITVHAGTHNNGNITNAHQRVAHGRTHKQVNKTALFIVLLFGSASSISAQWCVRICVRASDTCRSNWGEKCEILIHHTEAPMPNSALKFSLYVPKIKKNY